MVKKERPVRLDLQGQSIEAIVEQINKKYGEGTLIRASQALGLKIRLISTGVYALDYAMGGGIPENRFTEMRGPFSSLKTTIALKSIANFQAKQEEGFAFYEDGEKSFDPAYAKLMGCDLDRLFVINADSGEQAVDVMSELQNTGRHIFTVIDSIATLIPAPEIESSMDQNFQGLHPRLVNRMLRVLTGGMKRSMYDRTAATTTVLATNQVREKLGVVYGNPETSPGGRGREHYCSVMVRFNSSPSRRIMEKITRNGIEREIRVGQQVDFSVTKNKISGSQFEEGTFEYYVKPYKGHASYSFNNEEILFRYGVYFGLVDRSVVNKTELFSFDLVKNRREARFKEAILANPKLARKLYKRILAEVLKEKESADGKVKADITVED
jgi:protein RecA